ncbi:hypothetical protein NDU88_007637, partial [Pleurodeles waltl]
AYARFGVPLLLRSPSSGPFQILQFNVDIVLSAERPGHHLCPILNIHRTCWRNI